MVLKKSTRSNLMICLILSTLLLTGINCFAYVWCNESDTCFEAPLSGIASFSAENPPLGVNIAKGAGHMLSAHSQTLRFLNLIEMSTLDGLDFTVLKGINAASLRSLEKARESWLKVIRAAEITPYDSTVVNKLKRFDYREFVSNRSVSINANVFEAVVEYLQDGDTRGIYKKLLVDINALITRITNMRRLLDSEQIPPLKRLWELNQAFTNTMLFGQYVAEVFYGIQDNQG